VGYPSAALGCWHAVEREHPAGPQRGQAGVKGGGAPPVIDGRDTLPIGQPANLASQVADLGVADHLRRAGRLGRDTRTVLNVGDGTGSYEPSNRDVTAVEPSALMRAHRPSGAAPCVAATAERLPFEDQFFDAAMVVSTVHHWQDPITGLREMRRVARRVVVFTREQ
jgi:SAM-dependent methyltransferase